MRKIIYFLAVFIVAIFWASSVFAATWYVDNAAKGLNNGTSWANAWESFADIGWSTVSAGDTVYISGGSTSKTYTERLTIGASGSEGSPITIKGGQSTPHSGTVILDGGGALTTGILISGRSYVTVSGQLGSSSKPNMIVRNHQYNEVKLVNITKVDVGYLELGPHLYNSGGRNDDIIQVDGYLGGGNRIHHCKIHDGQDYAIKILPPSGTILNDDHLRIDHNDIYNLGHDGIHAGNCAGGLTIDHNEIHDQPAIRNGYADGMHLRGFKYVTVAYNKIYDLEGPDSIFAYIYLESTCTESANDIYVYNNVIYETDQSYSPNLHVGISFNCKSCTSLTNAHIINNTIVDMEVRGISFAPYDASPVSGCIVANNIIYNAGLDDVGGSRTVIALTYFNGSPKPTTGSFGDSPTPDIIWDYNLVDTYSGGTVQGRYDGSRYDYSEWKTRSGGDDNGVTSDPIFVNWTEGNAVNLHLASTDTAATNRGKNLSSYVGFNDDFDGNTRLGIWDIGAYENGQPDQTTPNPPTNLIVN